LKLGGTDVFFSPIMGPEASRFFEDGGAGLPRPAKHFDAGRGTA
jgi:hypothetical protein